MKMIWLLIKRWWYTGIFLVLLIPNISQAEYVFYYMPESETFEDVAKKYNVDISKITDDELPIGKGWRQVRIDLSPVIVQEEIKPTTKKVEVEATDVELFEVDDERVELMNQIIKLLMEIIRLQNEQKF